MEAPNWMKAKEPRDVRLVMELIVQVEQSTLITALNFMHTIGSAIAIVNDEGNRHRAG